MASILATHTHDDAGPHTLSHPNGDSFSAATHGHTHEILSGPGSYTAREMPLTEGRDWKGRALTIGIGGPVGSGIDAGAVFGAVGRVLDCGGDKRYLYPVGSSSFCPVGRSCSIHEPHLLRTRANHLPANSEDAEFLTRNYALPPERMQAIETGGCPHAAIREDISSNLSALTHLTTLFRPDLLLIESGGDDLAANYSRELADYIIDIIDVAGGDWMPRKEGPGITGTDLLVVNKCDLAEAVGADLGVMDGDARRVREGGPIVLAEVKGGNGGAGCGGVGG